jgi:AcrR family transcriptional regulator
VPKYVDHEQRRREVVDAAGALVVRSGRRALTVRNVADEVGCSTQVVSHYFTDMAELLHATSTLAADRARDRIDAVLAGDPLDLRGVIEAVLPLDAERRATWAIWFAFWTEALSDERLGADQRRHARSTVQRYATILDGIVRTRGRPLVCSVDEAAHRLGALVQGIAAQAAFDPAGWPPARQRAVLDGELVLLGLAEPTGTDELDQRRRRRA